MVDQFCLPQKILSTIQERILSGFIPHRTPIAMISQTEWIMALKKQISHDFYSKLTCLENAAVKPSMKHFKTNCPLKIHPETLLLSYCHESKTKLMIRHNFKVFWVVQCACRNTAMLNVHMYCKLKTKFQRC